ncbi:MAG TPA: hypothetical protein VFS67_06115 [Polyangiaceae bacterium]|nr:hypothetical protein [Polyangiaceae bacterium]
MIREAQGQVRARRAPQAALSRVLSAGLLALGIAAAGCAPQQTARAPQPPPPPPGMAPPGTPPLPPAPPVDPQRAAREAAQQLLDELALNAVRATGKVGSRLFAAPAAPAPTPIPSPDARVQLSEAANRLNKPLLEPLQNALAAVNANPLAAKVLAAGVLRTRAHCAKHDCDKGQYRAELAVLAPPLPDAPFALVRLLLSGNKTAVAEAAAEFTLLYRMDSDESDLPCAAAESIAFGLRVNVTYALGLSTYGCKNGRPLASDAREGDCCYVYDDHAYHFGTVKRRHDNSLRCDL